MTLRVVRSQISHTSAIATTWYSPILLNTLVEKGAIREQAYRWVQRNAMKRWLEGEDFLENLKKDEDIAKFMSNKDIEACFDVNKMLSHVDTIFARFGL